MDAQLINILKKYFSDKPIIRGYIFGSASRNEDLSNSDIDILVELDYSRQISLVDFIGWKLDLEKLTSKRIDMVSDDAVSKYIRPFIDKDKSLIYDRAARR
ncbi:MAG: nucleotidyltransferase domain-containing protein [Bacteroidota bacterium]